MTAPVYFLIGLGLLLFGANGVVNSALAIASRIKISPLIIGITAVALGTSLPEIVVTVFGGLEGGQQLALGNIIGSNIANICLIFGLSAFGGNMVVGKQKTQSNTTVYLLLSVIAFIILYSETLGFFTGVMLLVTGCAVLLWQVSKGLSGSHAEDKALVRSLPATNKKPFVIAAFFVLSLAALVWGGKLLVDNGIIMARMFNVSQAVIGLTAVALGTSMPELAVSVIGLMKRQEKLVIGNILGSNIFNILFGGGILGLYGVGRLRDGMTLAFFLFISIFFCFILYRYKGKKLPHFTGGIFLTFYALYLYTLVSK